MLDEDFLTDQPTSTSLAEVLDQSPCDATSLLNQTRNHLLKLSSTATSIRGKILYYDEQSYEYRLRDYSKADSPNVNITPVYLRCTERGCKAIAKVVEGILEPSGIHTHPPRPEKKETREFVQMMKRMRAEGAATADILKIMDGASPEIKKSLPSRSSLQRSLQGIKPSGNQSGWPYVGWQDEIEGWIVSSNIEDLKPNDKKIMVFFAHPAAFERMKLCGWWAIDSSFKRKPKEFPEMIVLGCMERSILIPCVYALLGEITEESYTNFFEGIKPHLDGYHPEHLMMEFDSALSEAAMAVYPRTLIKRSQHHFEQAIWREVLEQKLMIHYNQKDINKYIKALMAMCYLNPIQVPEFFKSLYQEMIVDKTARVLKDLFDIIDEKFAGMNDIPKFPPLEWALQEEYLRMEPTTFNVLESFHSKVSNVRQNPTLNELTTWVRGEEDHWQQVCEEATNKNETIAQMLGVEKLMLRRRQWLVDLIQNGLEQETPADFLISLGAAVPTGKK